MADNLKPEVRRAIAQKGGLKAGEKWCAIPIEERLWSKVRFDAPDKCWIWMGTTNKGYGWFSFRNKTVHTHRVAWELFNGPIPKGMYVLHKCDNPPCCNPNHLFLGTHLDNIKDSNRKGRHTKGGWKCDLSTNQREKIRQRALALPKEKRPIWGRMGAVAKWLKEPPFEERFWKRVEKGRGDQCWLWTKSVGTSGYGNILRQGKWTTPHKVAFELTNGVIPNGVRIGHTCSNRHCCNPKHLVVR